MAYASASELLTVSGKLYIYILYRVPYSKYTLPFKSLGSLRNVLISERKALFFSMKITLNYRNQKYSLDIVHVVNDYSSCKRLIFNGIST